MPFHPHRPVGWLALWGAALVPSAGAAEVNKYLPGDTEWVLSVNVKGLLDAPVVRQHAPALLQRYAPDAFTGLSRVWLGKRFYEDHALLVKTTFEDQETIRKNLAHFQQTVSRITLAAPWSGDDDQWLVILEGRFGSPRFRQAIDRLGKEKLLGVSLEPQTEGGQEFYRVNLPADLEPSYLAVLDESHLVLSPSRAYLFEALAKAAGKKEAKVKEELRSLLEAIPPQTAIWTVAAYRSPDGAIQSRNTITVGTKISFAMLVTTEDVDAAKEVTKRVAASLDEARAIVAGLARKYPALAPVVAVLQEVKPSRRRDNTVSVRLEIPAETLNKIASP